MMKKIMMKVKMKDEDANEDEDEDEDGDEDEEEDEDALCWVIGVHQSMSVLQCYSIGLLEH